MWVQYLPDIILCTPPGTEAGEAMIYTDKLLPERRVLDQYFTPRADVERCLSVVQGKPYKILDPAAGRGAWGEVARLRWPEATIWGVEIDGELQRPPDYTCWLQGDFLTADLPCWNLDLIIGNPPYSENAAEKFVRKAIPLLAFGG